MNAKRLLKVATVVTVAAAGFATAAPTQAQGPVPQIQPPLESVVYDPGAQFIAAGPNITVTLPVGKYVHLNISCNGCMRGQEINYTLLVAKPVTLNFNGSAWSYNRAPVKEDGLCDVGRDYWPDQWPMDWPQAGTLVFPCGITSSGSPSTWSPDQDVMTQTVQAASAPMTGNVAPTSVDCEQTQTDPQIAMTCMMLSMFAKMDARLIAMEQKLAQQPVQQPNRNGGKPNTGKPAEPKTVTSGTQVAQGENQTYVLKAGKGYHLNAWWSGDPHEYNYLFVVKNDVSLTFNGTLTEFNGVPAKSVLPGKSEKEIFPTDMSKLPANVASNVTLQ